MAIEQVSFTSIANEALAENGSTQTIVSYEDSTAGSAQRIRALLPGIVREVTSAHPWNHAVRRAPLNRTDTVDGLHRFQLPKDCLRWLPDASGRRIEREGRFLITDRLNSLHVRYIALVESPAEWPPYFVKAVVLYLAAAIAEGVTQSEGIKDRLLERAAAALKAAKRLDGLETGYRRNDNVISRSDWLGSRGRAYAWRHR